MLGGDRQDALVVLGLAIAARRDRAHVQGGGTRFGDTHRVGDGRGARRQGDGLLGLVDHHVRIAGPVEADARLRGAVRQQADVDAERGAGADVVGRGEASDRDVAAGVAGQRQRVQGGAAIAQPLRGRCQVATRGDAVRYHQQPRDGGRIDQAGAEADRQRQVGGGAGRRWKALHGRAVGDLLGARGEANHPRRRIAAFGGGAGQRAGRLTREGQRLVGDAVRHIHQRDRRDRARRASQRRAGQRGHQPRQHQRAQQGLAAQLAGREIRERAPREQPGQRCDQQHRQPERVLERQLAVRGRAEQRAHVVHRR